MSNRGSLITFYSQVIKLPPLKKGHHISTKSGNFETPSPASLLNRYFLVINYHRSTDLACFGMPNRHCMRTEVTFELNNEDLA